LGDMAQLFDNDIREMPNVFDFTDWILPTTSLEQKGSGWLLDYFCEGKSRL
jgi:hypothetical protein